MTPTKLPQPPSLSFLDRQAEQLAKRKYGEAWMDHVDQLKADMRELTTLRYDGLRAMSAVEEIDMKIRGIHMTPKHLRAERLEKWQAERVEKIAAYTAAKEAFEKLSSKINK